MNSAAQNYRIVQNCAMNCAELCTIVRYSTEFIIVDYIRCMQQDSKYLNYPRSISYKDIMIHETNRLWFPWLKIWLFFFSWFTFITKLTYVELKGFVEIWIQFLRLSFGSQWLEIKFLNITAFLIKKKINEKTKWIEFNKLIMNLKRVITVFKDLN